MAVSHRICTTLACTPSADSCAWQLAGSAAKQLVRGVAALDLQLENAGILSQLNDKELPDDVATDEGEEMSDAADVRMLPPGTCAAAVPPCWRALLHLQLPCPGPCFASPFPALRVSVQHPGCCKLGLAVLPGGPRSSVPTTHAAHPQSCGLCHVGPLHALPVHPCGQPSNRATSHQRQAPFPSPLGL